MALDLKSVKAKLAHSAKHAQALRKEISTWGERNPYSIMTEANADSTRYAVIVRVNEPPALYEWSLIVGDYIHALRCCLDHLVYAIACHEASPNRPTHEGKLQFPIVGSREDFDDAVICRKQLGSISDPVRAIIEAYQPYNRPHPDLPPLLSVLQEFSNRDKHKLISLAIEHFVSGELGVDLSRVDPPLRDGDFTITPGIPEVKDGAEIVVMSINRPAPNVHFDKTIFNIVIAVRHKKRNPPGPNSSDWTDFAALMSLMSAEVREIINRVSAKVV